MVKTFYNEKDLNEALKKSRGNEFFILDEIPDLDFKIDDKKMLNLLNDSFKKIKIQYMIVRENFSKKYGTGYPSKKDYKGWEEYGTLQGLAFGMSSIENTITLFNLKYKP